MKTGILVALLAITLTPAAALAATLTYSIQYVTTYAVSGTVYTNIGNMHCPSWDALGYDSTWVNRFAISATVTGLNPGEDVNLMGLGITATGGISIVTRPGQTTQWVPNNPTYSYWDSAANGGDGATVTSTVFIQNGDAGPSSHDLRGIAIIADKTSATTNQIGESVPFQLGTVYITWNGWRVSTLTVFGDPAASPWTIWQNNTNGSGLSSAEPAGTVTSGYFIIDEPEPATIAILTIGSATVLFRRRQANM